MKIICILYCIIWSSVLTLGGRGSKAKQTNGDPLFCDAAAVTMFGASFEAAVSVLTRACVRVSVNLFVNTARLYSHVTKYGLFGFLFLFSFLEKNFARPFGLKSFTSWCLLCDTPCRGLDMCNPEGHAHLWP